MIKTVGVVGSGLMALHDAWAGMIRDAFIKQSRFDPLHNAETEQFIYNRLEEWLAAVNGGNEALLEINHKGAVYQAKVNRGFFAWLASRQVFWIFIATVAACLFMSLRTETFLTPQNIFNVTRNFAFVARRAVEAGARVVGQFQLIERQFAAGRRLRRVTGASPSIDSRSDPSIRRWRHDPSRLRLRGPPYPRRSGLHPRERG